VILSPTVLLIFSAAVLPIIISLALPLENTDPFT